MTVPWETACGKALTVREREYLNLAAHQVEASFEKTVIVNIGVFRCASMYCLRAGAPRAHLVGIDIKTCAVKIHPGLRAEFIIKDSRTCYKNFQRAIHLLFLDGDHHYAVIKEDIKNWVPKVVDGGVVVFHDYAPLPKDLKKNPHLEGVRQAVDEWARSATDWYRLPTPDSLAAFQRRK